MKLLIVLLAVALAACGKKEGAPVPAAGPKSFEPMWVSERCYDGVIYLVTPAGGISPKISNDPTKRTGIGGVTRAPFVYCDKEQQ